MAKKSEQADARASCWYYTSSIFDILIEVELFNPKVPISLIHKARLDSLMCYSRVIN